MCGDSPLTDGIDRARNTPDYNYIADLIASYLAKQGDTDTPAKKLLALLGIE